MGRPARETRLRASETTCSATEARLSVTTVFASGAKQSSRRKDFLRRAALDHFTALAMTG